MMLEWVVNSNQSGFHMDTKHVASPKPSPSSLRSLAGHMGPTWFATLSHRATKLVF